MSIRIAGLQTAGTPADVSANLDELEQASRAAVSDGVDLLITPEMFLTGYDIGDRVRELADDDLLTPVRDIARGTGIALVVGGPERTDGVLYNAAYVVGADGSLLGTHRKAHLFADLDRAYFCAGRKPFTMVAVRSVRIATMICYDVEFPEAVRAAANAGAQLIAVPTAQMTPFAFVAEQVVRARAWENQVYVAYVNHDGEEGSLTYVGRSSIVGPDASILDSIEHGNGLILADVDPDVVGHQQHANPYLSDRRPEIY